MTRRTDLPATIATRALPRRAWLGAFAGCALAAVCLAGAASAAPAPSLAATLAAHCREREATSTLRARFVQTRSIAALGEEERSAGVVFYRKPDALRWQYSEPDDSWTVIRGREGRAVFPRIRQVHRLDLRGSSVDGLLSIVGFGACAPGFSRSFEIALGRSADGRPVLSLSPLRPEIAASFTRIELTLDPGDHLPRTVVLHESTGDTVRLDFTDLRRGVPIDPSLFELATPKDYAVVP